MTDKWLGPRGQLETMVDSVLRDGLSSTGSVHADVRTGELKRPGSEHSDASPPPQQGLEYSRTDPYILMRHPLLYSELLHTKSFQDKRS